MILHTIIDPQMIFPGEYNGTRCYKLKHGYCEYDVKEGKKIIRRIDSTNPADYLNRQYDIGNILQ